MIIETNAFLFWHVNCKSYDYCVSSLHFSSLSNVHQSHQTTECVLFCSHIVQMPSNWIIAWSVDQCLMYIGAGQMPSSNFYLIYFTYALFSFSYFSNSFRVPTKPNWNKQKKESTGISLLWVVISKWSNTFLPWIWIVYSVLVHWFRWLDSVANNMNYSLKLINIISPQYEVRSDHCP